MLLPLACLRLTIARKYGETADGHARAARARPEVKGRGRVPPHAHRARGGAHARVEKVDVCWLPKQRVVPYVATAWQLNHRDRGGGAPRRRGGLGVSSGEEAQASQRLVGRGVAVRQEDKHLAAWREWQHYARRPIIAARRWRRRTQVHCHVLHASGAHGEAAYLC